MYTNYITFNHKINKECYADSKIILININSFFCYTKIEEITARQFMSLYGNVHNTESVNIEEYMMENKVAVVYWIENPKRKISTLTFVNFDGNSKTINLNKGDIIMTTKINYKEEIIKKCQEAQNKTRVDVSNYLKTHNKIDIDTVKKIMKENYFPDSDKLPILVYGIGTNNICFVFDMFDIQIMLADNYDFDVDDMHSIEEELSYLLNINIHRSKVEIDGLYRPIPADVNISIDDIF